MGSDSDRTGLAPTAPPGDAAGRACAAAAAVALAGVYAPVLARLSRTWWEQPDYSHGFFVAPVALAIFWRLRPADGPGFAPSWWGWSSLAATLAARTAFHELGASSAERATLLPAVASAVVAYGGPTLLRATWPAVAYLAFMLTVPAGLEARLALPLQRIAASASGEALRGLGFWVLNEGNVLVLGAERLEVATACNGLAMLMSLSATVVAMTLLVPMARWKRASLLAALLPIALSCNVLRIVATAWCYGVLPTERARGLAHDAAGWLMMPLALALVWLELRWLSWVRDGSGGPAPPAVPAEPRRGRRRGPAASGDAPVRPGTNRPEAYR